MKTWADLADDVIDDVPGCSLATAGKALRRAAQILCEQALCWRVTLADQPTVSGTTDYAFALPAESKLVKLVRAKIDGYDTSLLLDGQEDGYSGVRALDLRNWHIVPAPTGVQQVSLTVALAPSDTATGLDDGLAADYALVLAKGAKAELLGMTSQPFSNPTLALALRGDFDEHVARIKVKVARAYGAAPLRVAASFM